jgi:hypothetical protein
MAVAEYENRLAHSQNARENKLLITVELDLLPHLLPMCAELSYSAVMSFA